MTKCQTKGPNPVGGSAAATAAIAVVLLAGCVQVPNTATEIDTFKAQNALVERVSSDARAREAASAAQSRERERRRVFVRELCYAAARDIRDRTAAIAVLVEDMHAEYGSPGGGGGEGSC
ncbi:hypothetical protein [Oricola cellulosilytica]|uniref:Uncharacterized protein n=1 Tax=Oricola cellulosilytica TaxID=1429082 RepID=A0A4R0PB08_9HYPH|nr:hypothetical protein [Oricola cellulosilytica]TCD14430.1 hypothetical protein E0D97_10215 [Oricola cellulosilytica]